MITALLIVFMLNGRPQVHMLRAESMEQCWAAVPKVAQKVPEWATLTCIEVREEKAV